MTCTLSQQNKPKTKTTKKELDLMWKWQSMFGMYVYSVKNIKKQGFALNFMMLTASLRHIRFVMMFTIQQICYMQNLLAHLIKHGYKTSLLIFSGTFRLWVMKIKTFLSKFYFYKFIFSSWNFLKINSSIS